jgi:hypothetical protein
LSETRDVTSHPSPWATLLALFCVLTACGCFAESNPRGAIEGEVMLPGGRPLPTGRIRFLPVEGTKGASVFAEIVDGKYSLDQARGPAVGKNRVEITALRKSGNKIPVPDGPPDQFQDVEEQYLPAQYNVASQIFVEVSPGQNKKDLTLDGVE